MQQIEEIENARIKWKTDVLKVREELRTSETLDQISTKIQRTLETKFGQHGTNIRQSAADIKKGNRKLEEKHENSNTITTPTTNTDGNNIFTSATTISCGDTERCKNNNTRN